MQYQKELIQRIQNTFKEHYGRRFALLFSPGRINLIGEHTDYTGGFVMPGAIDKGIYMAFAKNHRNIIRMYSLDLKEEAVVDLDEIRPISIPWANYILGVVNEIQKVKCNILGFDVVFGGDIPIGAGLSSSAALESGVGFALNHLFKLKLKKLQIIKAGQQAEHSFVGVRCGIMDQFASVMGRKAHVIQLDCRSLGYKYFPWAIEGYQILLCNSKVKHSLAESQYNQRRLECETGIRALQKKHPEVKGLRDVSIKMLEQSKGQFLEVIFERCMYVIEENNRVLEASSALTEGDIQYLGSLLFKSHKGLSEKYEVSCEELDFLVALARKNNFIAGARMMGGGFGGCTINLVKEAHINDVIEQFEEAYFEEFKIKLECYKVSLQNGTHLINQGPYGTIQS
ncbi:galactokinase [Flagellimonas allohymeniacidonis]|uniref:Galactokinase n=1 Tax=Flagellimonas allohymeniacidonis TaxID=2517819 RepID=A0A4Q8QF99_9FLAO|nr:galactokinase [Allomuricauda hymeniacidonis]TAI48357.1 galactokinase [Allomuricauda hymeniacidonis]